jgi:RNA polymerase sigma factor (sigma-70 family)
MILRELIERAARGEEAAWAEIVERFSGLIWATARAHRLSHAEAADVAQTTWLRLVENLDRIHDPERLGGWLATTARRECLRHIRLHQREVMVEDDTQFDAPAAETAESSLIVRERDDALRRAFARISERCQALLRMLAASDAPSYEEVSAALEMPIGAIGPTRARCLEKLKRTPELATYGYG